MLRQVDQRLNCLCSYKKQTHAPKITLSREMQTIVDRQLTQGLVVVNIYHSLLARKSMNVDKHLQLTYRNNCINYTYRLELKLTTRHKVLYNNKTLFFDLKITIMSDNRNQDQNRSYDQETQRNSEGMGSNQQTSNVGNQEQSDRDSNTENYGAESDAQRVNLRNADHNSQDMENQSQGTSTSSGNFGRSSSLSKDSDYEADDLDSGDRGRGSSTERSGNERGRDNML